MDSLFAAVNSVLSFVIPVSDFFWDFPKMFSFWKAIPLLGEFSLAIIVLVGSGIYFTIRLGCIQLCQFRSELHDLTVKRQIHTGISPLAAFFLSTAMRVGPGNIIGVTGAIAAGGPGALFWMWVSAFFGMATAYTECTLAQLFKERRGNEFVGGLPFYARRLCGNKVWVGVFLSLIYIFYAMMCLPAQGFNVVSSMGAMAEIIIGESIPVQSLFYYVVSVLVIFLVSLMAFGGIRRIVKVSNKMVPVMAMIYVLTVAVLIVANGDSIPYFFRSVFVGAFSPEAVFGGAFGVVLMQGVKRGLMSNEAGQGTITMPAAAAEAKHPCEQGMVSAVGVFLDTHIICTMTGFIIVMAHRWATEPDVWSSLGTYPKFLLSIGSMTPFGMHSLVMMLVSLCFCLFAYTCVIGFITFSEISANRISSAKSFIFAVRLLAIFVAAFGIFCHIAGYDLSNLWAFSDLGNIIIVYCNIPMLYLGFRYVKKATEHYIHVDKNHFDSSLIGLETDCWKK